MNKQHRYKKSWKNGNITVIECEDCGFRHQWPLPHPEQITDWYREKFGGTIKEGFKESKKVDCDYWRLAFQRRIDTYKQLFVSDCRDYRILDVGCGVGDFLEFFKESGWQVHGIEPSQNFHPLLEEKGIDYTPLLTDEISEEDWDKLGQFDVINMSMLLEHIREPIPLIRSLVEKSLKAGGIITVESPNDFNDLQEAVVETHSLNIWWIHQLHINYFSFESLENLFRKVAIKSVYRDCQFPLEFFLLFGDIYVGNGDLGSEVHHKRVAFEKALHNTGRIEVLRKLYAALSSVGLGRTSIVYGKKD